MSNRYMDMAILVINKDNTDLGPEGQHQHSPENPWGLHHHSDGTLGGAHLHEPENPLGLHMHGINPLRSGGHLHGSEAAEYDFSSDGAHNHFNDEDAKDKLSNKKEVSPISTDVDTRPKEVVLSSIVFPESTVEELIAGLDELISKQLVAGELLDVTDCVIDENTKAIKCRASGLPNAAFIVEKGAEAGSDGKTLEKFKHLPHHTKSGSVVLPCLRNALARVNQVKPVKENASAFRKRAETHLRKHASKLLGK